MKYLFLPLLPLLFTNHLLGEESIDPERVANTIILNELGVKNLRLETIETEESTFNKTVFAIGRVKDIPGRGYVISSRIPGRAVKVHVRIGDLVKKGETLVEVESRQPGNPPPIIKLQALRDGIVTNANVIEGMPVSPDDALLTISDRSFMWVTAEIPEQRASGIKQGTAAEISFPALGSQPIKATLLRFGVEADATAGSIHGIFELENSSRRLSPGMRAELDIIVSSREDVMSVPEEAVQGDPSSRVVYVKDFELENAFVKAPVVLGDSSAGWVEVIEGLFPGDEVVTRGSYALSFVGSGNGVSLKDALDAAHGHEHNEDGSEITSTQKQSKAGDNTDDHSFQKGKSSKWLTYYCIFITIAFFITIQKLWNNRRKEEQAHA